MNISQPNQTLKKPCRFIPNHSGLVVGCFGFATLRQYFSLYQTVSQRQGERKEMIDETKMAKQPLPVPTASTVVPCPTLIQSSRAPRHWKFTKHHRTTLSPPIILSSMQSLKLRERERERERERNDFEPRTLILYKNTLLRPVEVHFTYKSSHT